MSNNITQTPTSSPIRPSSPPKLLGGNSGYKPSPRTLGGSSLTDPNVANSL